MSRAFIDLMIVRADLIDHDYQPKGTGYVYEVFWNDKSLGRWTEPIYNSCRALLKHDSGVDVSSQGARWWRPGGRVPDMTIGSVAKGAKLAVEENSTTGPRIVKFKPYNGPYEAS